MRTVRLIPGALRGMAASALEVSAQLDAAADRGVTMTAAEAEDLARRGADITARLGELRLVLADLAMRGKGHAA